MDEGIPTQSYGVLRRENPQTLLEEVVLQVRNIGYAVLDSGYTSEELDDLSLEFDRLKTVYDEKYGTSKLVELDEHNTIRALLIESEFFLRLAFNKNLHTVLEGLIGGKYILNQQNGIINPPQKNYNQGAWHRDLPYQHFIATSPLAVNALFCVDDFTASNGATFVLPASHKVGAFPSSAYIRNNAVQIEAKKGQFIVLDCMLFHAGGANRTSKRRRAVNHVFTIPYFKQQINIPSNILHIGLSERQKELLGFASIEPDSILAFLSSRKSRTK